MRPLLLLLLLAGCAGPPAGPCGKHLAADLPALLDRNRLEAEIGVNGTPTRLVIDTGAERSVLGAQTVSHLLLARSKRSATTLTGLTGAGAAVSADDAYATLELGGGARYSGRVAVADLPGVGGLVGADVLSAYDVELDVPASRVRLWKPGACRADDLPWTGPRYAVGVDVSGGDRLLLPVRLDGAPITAELDSGASSSLLSEDGARRAGVDRAALEADPVAAGRGVGQGVLGERLHRFAELEVGPERIAGPRILTAPLQLRGADMLLGLDWLRSRRVWVSYGGGALFVQNVDIAVQHR